MNGPPSVGRDLVIEIAGAELDPDVRASVTAITLHQRASHAAQLELECEAVPGRLGPLAAARGVHLTLGREPGAPPWFHGPVVASERRVRRERSERVRLRAYDGLEALMRHRPIRRFACADTAAFARALLADHGLDTGACPAEPLPAVLVQHDVDDLTFLRRVLARQGVYFALVGRALRFFRLDDPAPARSIDPGLVECRYEENDLRAFAERSARYWDVTDLRVHRFEEGSGRFDAQGSVTAAAAPFDGDPVARRRLRARCAEDALAGARVEGAVEGDPELAPGTRIAWNDAPGEAVAGVRETVVLDVLHRIEPGTGWISEFDNEVPVPPADDGLLLLHGTVCEVDGSHGARLRLRLPALDDVETDWLQTAVPGAGERKGLVALPEVDDQVAALLFADNPARGLVLGGLYGERATPGVDRGGNADRPFVLRTARGQRIRMNDANGQIELRNSDGSFLDLRPREVRLHADCDIDIAAPGKCVRIRAARIDFEEA